jgi:hypothetical protein
MVLKVSVVLGWRGAELMPFKIAGIVICTSYPFLGIPLIVGCEGGGYGTYPRGGWAHPPEAWLKGC